MDPVATRDSRSFVADLTIGRLAAATGVKVETIRYYERAGLIAPPARTGGNYRSYSTGDLDRLRFIRKTRDLGFTLEEIRAMLDLARQRDRSCDTIDAIASKHLADVDRKIADLRGLRRELSAIISNCAGGTVGDCRILEAFGDDAKGGDPR
ncbi:helix-turn-helix domain-containing protein [Roseomonas aeriglobus]|nr:helix-turn-helix domain-containing protein [Roseomonas aeriglobus]